jgi:hypothetical protein
LDGSSGEGTGRKKKIEKKKKGIASSMRDMTCEDQSC